jgi:hypothetical protein
LLDVVERVAPVDREADEDNVRFGVRERAETVIVSEGISLSQTIVSQRLTLYARHIPKRELHVPTIDLNVRDIVLKDTRDPNLLGR